MKRVLGPALLAVCLFLGACADATSDSAEGPADPTSSTSPSSTPTGSTGQTSDPTSDAPSGEPVEFEEIALLSQTAAGGQVDPSAVRLDEPAERDAFLGQFETPGFGTRIERQIAAATVPQGHVLLGAVVSIGCDVPPGVQVTAGRGGWAIQPQEVADPLPECLAPVTTVALVAVPE